MNSQNNKYNTCIFDLDGTLTDTLEDLKNSVNFAMRSIGLPERSIDDVRRFVGNGVPKLIKRSVAESTSEADCAKALEAFKEYYLLHLNDNTKPYGGITQLLVSLKEMNVKTAVLSNKDDDAVNGIVGIFFSGLIDFSQGRKDSVPAKPSPQGIFEIMKKLNCDKETTVYIGDSDVDVETAHNAGLKCIGVTWGFRDRELLIQSGADFLVDSPREILSIIL